MNPNMYVTFSYMNSRIGLKGDGNCGDDGNDKDEGIESIESILK